MKRTVVMLAGIGLAVATAAPPAQAKPPAPPPPTVSFSSATYSVAEGAGSVTVTANRTDSTGRATTVVVSTSVQAGDTATANSDFTPVTSRTLTFKGKRSVSTTVPILSDGVAEPGETFHVVLSSPSSPTVLGTPSSATVTIVDDDVPAAPANLDATAVPPDTINLSWDANTDYVTGYDVLRATISGGSYTSVGTPTTNSFSDTGLSAGTYYYVVRATNGAGSSTDSAEVFATLSPSSAGIENGGFETGDFTGWTAGVVTQGTGTATSLLRRVAGARAPAAVTPLAAVAPPTPVVQDVTVYGGSYAAHLGGPVGEATPSGASYVYQDVSVPASGQDSVRFYYESQSTGGMIGVATCDASVPIEEAVCDQPLILSGDAPTWQTGEYKLTAYQGQTVRLLFVASQSPLQGSASLYLDDVTMPTAGPENLQAVAVAPGEAPPYEIDLSWDAASAATGGYSLLRSTTSGGPYTQVTATTSTSYQDTTVNPATYYCYVVRAVIAGGESGNSNESCAEVVAETVFNGGFESGDFTGWTAGAKDESGPVLAAALGTRAHVAARAGATVQASVTPPLPTVQDATVHGGTYAAYLGDPVADSSWMGRSYVYTDVRVPAAGSVLSFFYRPQTDPYAQPPQVLVCEALPPTSLSPWDNCGVNAALPFATLEAWHHGQLALDGSTLGGQTVRVVLVTAQGRYGDSQLYLDDVSLETPVQLTTPDAPANVTANADGPFQTSLTWDAATGATSYEVSRSDTTGGPYTFIGDTDGTSFVDRGLTPATTYYYVVRAVASVLYGDLLSSADSTEADVTTAPAVATVLDTLEGSTTGWTTTGVVGEESQSLWHLVDGSSCATPAYASPTHAFYYGLDSTCTYDTTVDVGGSPQSVLNQGTLTSPAYTIPAGADAVSFDYLLGTECQGNPGCVWDEPMVEASYDGGSSWVPLGRRLPDTGASWQRVYLPISPSGTSLQVRFTFDTRDYSYNSYLGWMVDDLSVYTAGQTSGTFQNTSTIFIPSAGAAGTYPSTVAVSGLVGTVTDVSVTLNGFTHSAPSDVDVLLVGPAGQKVVLFGDAGQDIDVSGVSLTFDATGSVCVPQSSQIVTGTYKPCAAYDGTAFSSPAPAAPYATTLGEFDGTDPNGTWKLFVYDDMSGDYGQLSGGWGLSITTS